MKRHRNLHFFCIGLLLLGDHLFSQTVNRDSPSYQVNFHGATVVKSQLIDWLELDPKTSFTPELLYQKCRNLLRGYADQGWPFARIDSVTFRTEPSRNSISLDIYLVEGLPLRLGQIEMHGLDSLQSERIKNRFDSRTGQKISAEKLEQDFEDAVTQLEKQGYPFARLEVKEVVLTDTMDKTELGIRLQAVTGPKLLINEIQIAGTTVTQRKVILRELGIKPGQLYHADKVARIPARLLRLGFLDRVAEPEVFVTEKNEGGLLIRVTEGNASKFDGVLGYTPATGSQKGYLTGLIDIVLGNLLGTGRSLRVHWQKRDRQTQDLFFHYREPWLGGLPLHVGFGFEQLIQDTTYVHRNMAMDISLPLLESFTLNGKIEREDVTPDSIGSYILAIPQSRGFNAAIGLAFDSRDDRLNPRRGMYYQTTLQSGKKENLGPTALVELLQLRKNISNKRFTIDLDFYTALFARQILAISLHGRQIRSNEDVIPLPDLYRLGGTRTLRGYREDQFLGDGVAWSNLEYRYLLGRRSRAFVFLDTGYYTRTLESGRSDGYKMGYGFGFRIETGLGILGVDYGLGQGSGAFGGLVHVGLINEF